MERVVLSTAYAYPLRELVESALATEARAMQAGIQRTEERLTAFEARYQLSTAEFLRRYAEDELEETLDSIEWVGEVRLLERMQQRLNALQGITIAN